MKYKYQFYFQNGDSIQHISTIKKSLIQAFDVGIYTFIDDLKRERYINMRNVTEVITTEIKEEK